MKVFKYGDNVDTDVIIPARYLNSSEWAFLAEHCMEDIDKKFAKEVKTGDCIVCEKNFGCGSSREHAPIAILASGVSVVIAKSYARIFYRNCINIGLAPIECNEAEKISYGDEIAIDYEKGTIENKTKGETYAFTPLPAFVLDMREKGGLINRTKAILAEGGK
ncbi:3-isopropylmalate dehydratase small subunit [Clostridia bacterium]|nr:3-isopropylmalate dehydratase small subunit [Clostridia bacterium]